MSRRAVFLDRDGTLNTERSFVSSEGELEVLPGVVPALRSLATAGFALVVLTNQSGIARGLFDECDLARIHAALHASLERLPAAYFHCPHHPDAGDGPYTRACPCRKPKDGLLRQAIEVLDLDPRGSWLVGDSARDLLPARGHGIHTVLLHSGKPVEPERQALLAAGAPPNFECADLAAAARRILAG